MTFGNGEKTVNKKCCIDANLRSSPILAVLIHSLLTATANIFVSPCPLECYFQSETKIEPDLRLYLCRFRTPRS